jgi:hypothetical protein
VFGKRENEGRNLGIGNWELDWAVDELAGDDQKLGTMVMLN